LDGHPVTREGLTSLIQREEDLEVCGAVGSPAEAISAIQATKPDMMITDMSIPGRNGIEFLKDIHAVLPSLPVLVLSVHDETFYAERALRSGARGYLMKDAPPEKLMEVLRLILNGGSYVSPSISARLVDAAIGRRPRGSSSPIEKLSDREFEVFQHIGNGRSTKEIAGTLHLSPKTVDVHRGRIKQKLQIRDAISLLHHAVRWVETQCPQG
jgi:DNA-binding NarL/FixJ family response regulator